MVGRFSTTHLVVHAFQLTMSAQLGEDEAGYANRTRVEATARIRETVEALGYAGEREIHVGLTSPGRALLECLDRFAPDLVVMGTPAHGGLARLLHGRMAERLLRDMGTRRGHARDSVPAVEGFLRRKHVGAEIAKLHASLAQILDLVTSRREVGRSDHGPHARKL